MIDDGKMTPGMEPAPRPSFTERLAKPVHDMPEGQIEQMAGSGAYKPFGFLPTGSIGAGCEVFSWVPGTDVAEGIAFQYRFLMEVMFTGDDVIRLMLPDCVVLIEGNYLTDLRRKLMRGVVTFVQEYHPRLWPEPPMGETIVRRARVVRPGSRRASE